MTTFTFTSADLEKVNEGKTQEDKIFPRIHNVRIAEGLMQEDGITPNLAEVENAFMIDATRSTSVVFKRGQNSEAILQTDNTGSDKAKLDLMVQQRVSSLTQKGLSEQQVNDFKFMTNQGNIGSIAADFLIYFNNKDIFQNPEKWAFKIQNMGGTLAQLEISKIPPHNQEHLTYKTATKITMDKDKRECYYSPYGMSSSYDITSKDNLIITAEVDLGPLGAENYTPKVTCSIHAEGKIAENILKQIKEDIPVNQNQKSLSSKKIKAQYEEIAVKTLQMTGFEDIFRGNVKDDIDLILSQGYISTEHDTNKSKLGAIREFKSTPKLFAEVLVDKIDKILINIHSIEQTKELLSLAEPSSKLLDNSSLKAPPEEAKALIYIIASTLTNSTGHNFNQEDCVEKSAQLVSLLLKDKDTFIAQSNAIIKEDIKKFLTSSEQTQSIINLPILQNLESTPQLFAEVLVERISEINQITDNKERSQAIKQLSDNAANIVDQPKGYMKILVNNTAKEMAKAANIALPKEGIISKISGNIKLMLAKINVKIRGKSNKVEKTKDFIIKARTARQTQARAR